MVIRLKKITAICFLTIVSFLFMGHSQAYVLQGLHLIDLMIEQLGEARGLYVSQDLIFYRLVSQVDIESNETVEESQGLDNTEIDLPAEQTRHNRRNQRAQHNDEVRLHPFITSSS